MAASTTSDPLSTAIDIRIDTISIEDTSHPSKWNLQKYLDIFTCPDEAKRIIIRHLRIANAIYCLGRLENFLSEELLNKKGVAQYDGDDISTYVFEDTRAELFYLNCIMRGQRQVSGFDFFPCSFQCALERTMFEELECFGITKDNKMGDALIKVYYGIDKRDLKFNKYDWCLSDDGVMTDDDMTIVYKYKELFYALYKLALNYTKECEFAEKLMRYAATQREIFESDIIRTCKEEVSDGDEVNSSPIATERIPLYKLEFVYSLKDLKSFLEYVHHITNTKLYSIRTKNRGIEINSGYSTFGKNGMMFDYGWYPENDECRSQAWNDLYSSKPSMRGQSPLFVIEKHYGVKIKDITSEDYLLSSDDTHNWEMYSKVRPMMTEEEGEDKEKRKKYRFYRNEKIYDEDDIINIGRLIPMGG